MMATCALSAPHKATTASTGAFRRATAGMRVADPHEMEIVARGGSDERHDERRDECRERAGLLPDVKGAQRLERTNLRYVAPHRVCKEPAKKARALSRTAERIEGRGSFRGTFELHRTPTRDDANEAAPTSTIKPPSKDPGELDCLPKDPPG